jgi:GT2 family glycosyltransferase
LIFVGTCIGDNGEKYRSVALPSLQRVLEPVDMIRGASGDRGIAKVYNGFIAEARSLSDCEALVLVHDDVEIVDANFRAKVLAAVRNEGVGVVGVIGGRGLQSIKWWEARVKVGRVHEANRDVDFGELSGDVDVIDGLMMILAREAFDDMEFDEVTCPRFHGYDIDFCLAAKASGLRVIVEPIDVIHRTNGGYGDRESFESASSALDAKWPMFIRPLTPGERGLAKLQRAIRSSRLARQGLNVWRRGR